MLQRRPMTVLALTLTLLALSATGRAQSDMTPVNAAKPATLTITANPDADSRAMPPFTSPWTGPIFCQ